MQFLRALVDVRLAPVATETGASAGAPEGVAALETRTVVLARVGGTLVRVCLTKLSLVARACNGSQG